MNALAAWALAAAMWAGCLLPASSSRAVAGAVGAGGLLLTAALVVRGRIGGGRQDLRRLLVAAVALGLLGSGTAGARGVLADGAVLAAIAERGGAVEVAATVVTEPRVGERGAWAVVRVTAVDGRRIRERAAIRLDAADPPELGEHLAVRVTARPLARDGFDAHLRRLHAVAALDPAGEVAVTAPAAAGWRATSWLRARSRAVANARLDPDRAAIVTGLLTGDVRGQTPERRDQLAAAGLTHLVVVSGRHVGLALAGVLGLAVLLGAGARGRRVAALVALVGYATLVR